MQLYRLESRYKIRKKRGLRTPKSKLPMNKNLCITKKGLQVIKNRIEGLSVLERRLLILSNGKREIGEISGMMKGADVVQMARKLIRIGLLRGVEPPATESEVESISISGDSAQEQMLAALDLLSNSVDSELIRSKITSTESNEELKDLIEEWYSIISSAKKNEGKAKAYKEHVDKTIVTSYMSLF